MALAFRLVVVCSALLLVCVPAVAQLPVAPEPHLALDELAREYKRFELALPPENAELVRIKQFPNMSYEFGFRLPPRWPGEASTYLIGTHDVRSAAVVELIKPDHTALEGIELRWMTDLLCLVAQCRIRGESEFAKLLYARVRENTPCTRADVMGMWRAKIYEVWHPRIWWEGSDRKEVLRFLKEAYPDGGDTIRDLELTVAPRKSKPGTAAFLIDNLTEYRNWWGVWEGAVRSLVIPTGEWERGEEPYLKLAELGFDAVPALLEHLGDRRFTRSWSKEPTPNQLFRGATSYPLRVGHVTGQLLDDLSGGMTEYWIGGEKMGDPKQGREWLEKAQKIGEEKWLTDHVLPALDDNGQEPLEVGGEPNRVIARALGAKYPARLAEAYRTVLTKRPLVTSQILANAIAVSKLPREKKLALLEEGAVHKRESHRSAALDALADLDAPTFHKHLIATFKSHPEDDLVNLVRRTDDPACWDALATNVRQKTVESRLWIIDGMRGVWWGTPPEQIKKTRREHIRFLIGFLSDDSVTKGDYPGKRVQDAAALALAAKLELKMDYYTERGPLARFFLRAVVAKAAAEELTRLKK